MATPLDDERIARGMATQFALKKQRLADGEAPIGWKAGFGAPAVLEKLKLDACLVGFMHDKNKLGSGATVSLAGWSKPAAEPEIAIHLGKDVAAGADAETARAAIAAIGPAIELVDLKAPLNDVEAILSGNIFHRHVIVGPTDSSRAGGATGGLNARVVRNGEEIANTPDIEALTGPLVAIVQRIANTVGPMGETLKAGQVIIAGSIVPAIFLNSDDKDLSYTLEPIGNVSVSFGG
jgi:2-keto-4-pentenoate hydratase